MRAYWKRQTGHPDPKHATDEEMRQFVGNLLARCPNVQTDAEGRFRLRLGRFRQ